MAGFNLITEETKKSLTVLHIPRQLADDLQAWRLECEEKAKEAFSKGTRKSASLSEDVFIFENEDGGFIDTDNYRKRVLHQGCVRTTVAQADIPGHSQNDRKSRTEKGDD